MYVIMVLNIGKFGLLSHVHFVLELSEVCRMKKIFLIYSFRSALKSYSF